MRTLLLSLLLSGTLSFAQITGNDKTVDKKAILVDETVLKRIPGEWVIIRTINTVKDDVQQKEYLGKVHTRFKENGDYDEAYEEVIGLHFNTIKVGSWTKSNNTTIRIDANGNKGRFFLDGHWVIYESTDSTMRLVRILTSSGDWKKEVLLRRAAGAQQ